MKKTLIYILFGGLLFGLAFGWGMAAGRYRVFPIAFLKSAKERVSGPPVRTDFFTPQQREPVECPSADTITVLAMGQSNAANELSHLSAPNPDIPAFQFYSGKCYYIEDPVLGASGHRGSLWALYAQELAVRTGRPVVMITTAVNGSSVAQWTDERAGYLGRTLSHTTMAEKAGLAINLVIWIQGETDTYYGTPDGEYARDLQKLIDTFRDKGVDVPWIVSLTSVMPSPMNGSEAVRRGQASVIKRNDDVFMGPDTDRLRGYRYRYDLLHFNFTGKAVIVNELVDKTMNIIEDRRAPSGFASLLYHASR